MRKQRNIFSSIIIILIIAVILTLGCFLLYWYRDYQKEIASIAEEIIEFHPYDIEKQETKQEVVGNIEKPIINEVNKQTEPIGGGYAEDKYYYHQLDNTGKIIYDSLLSNKEKMKDGNYTISFSTQFNELLHQPNGEEILNTAFQSSWDAFITDHPEIFYLDPNKVIMTIETITKGRNTTYRVSIGPNETGIYLIDGFADKGQVENAIAQMEQTKRDVLSNVEGESNYQKIIYAHDWIVDNFQYDSTFSRENAHNLYGAMQERNVVCEGYAKALKYLLDNLGVPCIIVSGRGTNSSGQTEAHAWNYVYINNTWYAIDPTWDDPIMTEGRLTNRLRYQYFMKGSSFFNQSHINDGKISEKGFEFQYPTLSIQDYK